MPRSVQSLQMSGSISNKQMGKFAKWKGQTNQPTKMADFNTSTRDEGKKGQRAVLKRRHINQGSVQTTSRSGAKGAMSKGGQAGAEFQPKREHINGGKLTGKKWIAGGDVSASNPKTGNTRMLGRIPAQGGQYGGGGRNTQ